MNFKEILQEIKIRQILTSRGIPTVEVDFITTEGLVRSSCPSGASTGTNEAKVLVDNKGEYAGKSVTQLIKKVKNDFLPLIRTNVTNQNEFDELICKIDGTNDKSKFGANILLPLSLCYARTNALFNKIPLYNYISQISNQSKRIPIPHFNVINGGMHSGNGLKFQEIMIAFQYDSYTRNLEQASIFYQNLKSVITEKYGKIATGVGDEGGFAPPITTLEEALDLIMETYSKNKFTNMKIAIDSAASSFFSDKKYNIGPKMLSSSEMVDYYISLIKKYPLIYSLEDPFAEDDYHPWIQLTEKIGNQIKIIGDDLTVTNKLLVKEAIDKKMCNALLVKLNQVGTVTETIEACKLARENGFMLMVSHRSGETSDTFISDFAVGIGAEAIKSGAPCRGERVEKYNELLRIEEEIHE